MSSADEYRRNKRLGIRYLKEHQIQRRTLGVPGDLLTVFNECARLMDNKASWSMISPLLDHLLQHAPNAPAVWFLHWRAYMHEQQFEKALEVGQRYYAHVFSAVSCGLVGKAYMRLNKPTLAIQYFIEGLEREPNANTFKDLYRILYDRGEWDIAEKYSRRWCEEFHSADAYQALAEVLRKRQRYHEALVALANIPDHKRSMQAWLCQGYCYFHTGDWDSSLESFIHAEAVWRSISKKERQRLLQQTPDAHPRFRWHVGVVFLYNRFVEDLSVVDADYDRFMDRLEPLLHQSVNWISSQRLDALPLYQKKDFVSALAIIVGDEYLWGMIISRES